MYFSNNVPSSHLISLWLNRIATRTGILSPNHVLEKPNPVADGIKRSDVDFTIHHSAFKILPSPFLNLIFRIHPDTRHLNTACPAKLLSEAGSPNHLFVFVFLFLLFTL